MLRITFALALLARVAAAQSHADLFVDITLPARLAAGQPVLNGVVRNNGPDTAENVTVFASPSNGQRFEIPIGTVYPIAGKSFMLTFPAADDTFQLDVRVSSTTPDPDSANDTASGAVQVTSAPKLSLFFNFPIADPGQPVLYEAHISNQGINDGSHVAFTFSLDGGWTFGESLMPRMQCTSTAGQTSCTIDTIAAGETFVGLFTLRAPDRREGQAFQTTPITITSDRGVFEQPHVFFGRSIYRHVVVTSTDDAGEGSLRQAIVAANATGPGIACKIDFDVALGAGDRVATIQPLTPLPALTAANTVVVDGSTQRAAHGDTNPDGPEVEINGARITSGSGLESSGRVEFRDLVVNGFPGNGIDIRGGTGRVVGCYVGSDATGRSAVPNGGRGVVVNGSLSEIRDSVISGNGRSGIFVAPGYSVGIANNRIGVAAGDELLPLGNGASGIYFGPQSAECSVIGNVIGFNGDAGIGLDSRVQDITMSANANASNGGLPIDYGIDGVTSNGPPFSDVPPFPILTATRFDQAAGKTIVEGRVDVQFIGLIDRVELFASESAAPRQSAQFLGRVPLSQSSKAFRFEYDGDLRGRFITATYTRPGPYYPELAGSRTSELSDPIGVEGEATVPLRRLPHGADMILHFGGPFQLSRLSAGEMAAISFDYSNAGPEEARDVALTIDIKGTAAVKFFNGSGDGTCRLEGSERIVCTQSRLAAGASSSFSFVVQAPLQAATIAMTASLTSSTDDADRSNNDGKITIQISDAPTMNVGAQFTGPTDSGATAVYAMYVTTFGHLAAHNVTLTISLRTGWTFVATGGGWQCTSDAVAVTCQLPTLEPGTSTFDLTLRAPVAPQGQRRDVSVIHVKASPPLGYEPTVFLTTQVFRLYTVTSTADDGPGTLRDVITRANSECPPQEMACKAVFSLPAPAPPEGYFSIRPRTPLPAITTALIIDARTQSDVTGDSNPLGPEVELKGSGTATGSGIVIHTGQVAGVRGLAINRFPENGIAVDLASNASFGLRRVIADCYIGTDPSGRTPAPNALRGIAVSVSPQFSSGLNIVDNVISGNGRSGIFIANGSDVRISGNRVGVAAGEGLAALGNGASGIYLGSASDVGVDQNVIAFNRDVGIGSDLSATRIGLQRNTLIANGQLGIDYGLDGPTLNDSPNRPPLLPELPLITSAVWDGAGGVTRIEGIAPPSNFASDRGSVDLYRNSAADPRGFGPAEEWIGEVVVDFAKEPRQFVLTVPRNLQGSFITATFTRVVSFLPSRWTSELSAGVPVTP